MARPCFVDGCKSTLACRHPSDPKCARAAREPQHCIDQSCPGQVPGEVHYHQEIDQIPITRVVRDPAPLEPAPKRCDAWYYPGMSSWDIQLRSRSDGEQCILAQGHFGPHETDRDAVHATSKSWAKEQVDHPSHYGGKDNPYEAIKVLAAWRLGFLLGNAVKYISRAGKKDPSKLLEDLRKAKWYLSDAIDRLERGEELF